MPRIRYIKADFFKDEDLVCLDPMVRLFFAGLWCYADKVGRLDYRVRYLKAEIFPHEEFDVVGALNKLAFPEIPDRPHKHFIIIYEVDNKKYIEIKEFTKHQKPHHTEKESIIPPPIMQLTVKQPLPIGESVNNENLSENKSSVKQPLNNGAITGVNGDGKGNGKGNGEGNGEMGDNKKGALYLLKNEGNKSFRNYSVRGHFIINGFPYEEMNTQTFWKSWLRLLDWFASLPPVGYLDVQGQESKLRKLNEFGKNELQWNEIINKAIEKKWKDIYPLDKKIVNGKEQLVVQQRRKATD